MRIVTWNCNMAAHTKLAHLLALRPDIAVVPECAAPEVGAAKKVYGAASSHAWVGEYDHKGLAVLAFGGYTVERVAGPDIVKGRFAVAVRVRGPHAFNLLAIWAQDGGGTMRYVRSAVDAFGNYDGFLRSGPTVVAGDFNSNSVWDVKAKAGHAHLVERLRGLGLESAYHAHFNEQQGSESRPTFFQNRNQERPFHIDYVFVPREWTVRCDVEVGHGADWLKHSDHMPLVVSALVAEEQEEQAMPTSNVPTVAAAIAFAAAKHVNQVDRAGQPYILHPLRVMAATRTDEERRVALLHDVVEDCGVTLEDLVVLGYPEREVMAIDALTKREDEHDDYPRFINRVLRNPLATRVKLADVEDNLDVRRLEKLSPKDFERLAKYHEARRRLLEAR